MKRKQRYILLIDTETTISGNCFDFGFYLVERKPPYNIIESGGFIIRDFCKEKLFHNLEKSNDFFSFKRLADRTEAYRQMLRNGTRKLITVVQLSAYMANICSGRDVTLSAYNLPFDLGVLTRSGIRCAEFCNGQMDLMDYAKIHFLKRKGFMRFILRNGLISPKGFARFNVETIYQYLTNDIDYKEPHTALEDLIAEYRILCDILRQKKAPIKGKLYWRFNDIKVSNFYKTLHP